MELLQELCIGQPEEFILIISYAKEENK